MFVTFHFKMIVKISIQHILMVNALKKSHLWDEKYLTFHMTHKHNPNMWNHMLNKYYKFHKDF